VLSRLTYHRVRDTAHQVRDGMPGCRIQDAWD